MKTTLTLLTTLLLAPLVSLHAAELFVTTNGDDKAADTLVAPYRTLMLVAPEAKSAKAKATWIDVLDAPAVMAKSVALKPYVQQDRMPGLLRKADCPEETEFKVNPQLDFAKNRTGKLHTLRFGIFALNWGEESQFLKPEDAAFLAQLEGNAEHKENLKKNFEELRRLMTEKFKLDVYSNKSPIDHQFYTTNVNIGNTGIYNGQRSVGGAGAVTGVGAERLSVPYLWIFVGMVKNMATKYPSINTIIAHEFCHTVAISVGRAKESRWGFVGESYANFIGMRASQTCHVLSQFHESRFFGLDNLQFRYATWIWWDFLARHPHLAGCRS